MRTPFFTVLASTLAASVGLASITAVEARPKRPAIPVCSSAQLDQLANATSQQVVATCAIQGRFWVCAEDGKAKCCSENADGSLGHCSSSVSYRVGAMPVPLTPPLTPPLTKSPAAQVPATQAPASVAKPGVIPK